MAQKKEKKSSKKKNTSLFTAAVVVLALILIIIIFLVKKDQILSNFKETNFFGRVFGSNPEFVENYEAAPKENQEESEIITLKITPEKKPSVKTETSQNSQMVPDVKTQEEVAVKPQNDKAVQQEKINIEQKDNEKVSNATKKVEEKKPETPAKQPPAVTTTDLQVCFVYVDADGSVLRKIIKKTVPKSDSPLTTAINLLLKGPDSTKSDEKNCMSLIPSGTKLLGARVQDGVAYLSFSEDFLVNSYGIDGYQNQLMQVVYTATAFSTVNSVQFLIEGEKVPYLSEGIWIGSPLSKSSF